jgi:hypothetical protein
MDFYAALAMTATEARSSLFACDFTQNFTILITRTHDTNTKIVQYNEINTMK